MPVPFTQAKNVYFIGIKGVAMAGLALIARQMGKAVAGSDVSKLFGSETTLQQAGVKIFPDFSAHNLAYRPDLVIVGASWPKNHPEVQAALKLGLPIIAESEFRGFLSRQRQTIAVCGVHGKSTTTAMLAWVFAQAGLDPGWLVGTSAVAGLPGSGHWGAGKYFICEGDEYAKSQSDKSAKFLDLDPWATIITSIEWEHVDVYPDVKAMILTFRKLAEKTDGPVVACTDWPEVAEAVASAKEVIRYGSNPDADFQVTDFHLTEQGSEFTVRHGGKEFLHLASPLIGKHNALNATAALIVAEAAGIKPKVFAASLQSFQGLARRQQVSVHDGVTWIDDYGHHPTEISRTLEAIRERYPKQKIWVVFQPHLASRTRALMPQFAKSFAPANRVLIADLFASAREPDDATAAKDLATEIGKYHEAVRAGGNLNDCAAYLKQYIQPGEVAVTMGAGDVYRVRSLMSGARPIE